MKTILLILAALLLASCQEEVLNINEDTYLIDAIDVTSPSFETPDCKEIIALTGLHSNIWSGCTIKIIIIGQLEYSHPKVFRLEPANKNTSNRPNREARISILEGQLRTYLKSIRPETEQGHTIIHRQISKAISDLNKSTARNKVVVVNSDLMENEDVVSFYDKEARIAFTGQRWEIEEKQSYTEVSIELLNQRFKTKSYGRTYLENRNLTSACNDFYFIFTNESGNVVLELISLYFKALIIDFERKFPAKHDNITEDEYNKAKSERCVRKYERFSRILNEVFLQFKINTILSTVGFIPRQENYISTGIYKPVIELLANPQWESVNSHLRDAFSDFRLNTPQGFSNCITNTVTAIQAFLQILVHQETGKGDISELLSKSIKNKLIESDQFNKDALKNIISVLMSERKLHGTPHPKKEYANIYNAQLILNLAMVFLQHCIQFKPAKDF